MSIRIKKKSKLYKLIEEPKLIDSILFGFLGTDYLNLLVLDKIIHHTLKGRIRYHINQTMKSFINEYRQYFDIQPKMRPLKPIFTQKGELKLAIPIYFSISKLKKQFQYCISYSYETDKKHKTHNKVEKEKGKNVQPRNQYAWNCQFSVSKNSNRTLWIYKENHNYADMSSYLMDVIPVCLEDRLCIICPFYSSGHPVHNLKFYPLTISPVCSSKNQCQVQKMYAWTDYNSKKPLDFEVEDLVKGYPEELITKSIKEYSLQNYYRIELECKKSFRHIQVLDCTIRSFPANKPITSVLKKKGCYNDQENYLEMRCGDTLIIYIIKS